MSRASSCASSPRGRRGIGVEGVRDQELHVDAGAREHGQAFREALWPLHVEARPAIVAHEIDGAARMRALSGRQVVGVHGAEGDRLERALREQRVQRAVVESVDMAREVLAPVGRARVGRHDWLGTQKQ